uniref:Uncharacterized protein n=1 Tax=Glossina palpalis gambiensis TaxID=67801 RepID=A0A1B0BCV5_9MUSC
MHRLYKPSYDGIIPPLVHKGNYDLLPKSRGVKRTPTPTPTPAPTPTPTSPRHTPYCSILMKFSHAHIELEKAVDAVWAADIMINGLIPQTPSLQKVLPSPLYLSPIIPYG